MRISCIIFSVFLPNSVIVSCLERLTHGYRLDSFTTEIISNIGVHTCMKECLLRKPHCQSINYNTQHFQCGINSRGADDIKLEGVPDYSSIFANVENVSRETLGNCEDAMCSPLHRCVTMKQNSVCISTACKKGFYGKDGQCLPCPMGQYNNGSKQWCSYCPPGSYSNKTGSSLCQLCPPGTYQTKSGSLTCSKCSVGSYQDNTGQTGCKLCPVGMYQENTGQGSCIPCDTGTYQHNSGSTVCYQCRVGTYQSNTGQASCLSCAPGSYQEAVGMSSCKPCQPGSHQSYWEQTQCTACTGNQYQDQPGQAVCKHCSGHYQCVNTAKTQCISLSSVQYSYCTGEKFVGYMWFYQCKQHCLNMGSSCHGIVYPRNHESWCYWCPSAQQDYYHNGDYWDLTVCV